MTDAQSESEHGLTPSQVQHIDGLVQEWLSQDRFEETRQEIRTLHSQGRYRQLQKQLEKRIAFGTAGLRARMTAGFSCMNPLVVVQTTQGLVEYILQQQHDKTLSVVIGYDGRHHSAHFARLTASVFLSRGFHVHLFSRIVPTPFVPFGVRLLGAVAGIMITASHNPKADNGYKLYWHNGCQIVEPHDTAIAHSITQNLQVWDQVDLTCKVLDQEHSSVEDPLHTVVEQYFSQIQQYCYSREDNSTTDLRISYTAMHGVGAPWVKRAFHEFGLPEYVPVVEQLDADPEFPTVAFPNPEEGAGALKLAMQTAERSGARIILANDPDADRLAVAEHLANGQWRIYNGNEIALLLAHWTWTNFRKQNPNVPAEKCVMINSTVSSKVLRSMAQKEGFIFEETLTGFKWIGNKADEYVKRKDEGYHFLFGYEVEIGFAVGDMSLDKDGVRTAAVFYEMAHNVLRHHDSLSSFLESLYARYGFFLMNTHYFFTPTTEHVKLALDKIRNALPQGKNHGYPERVGTYEIVNVRDLATGFELQTPDHKPSMPVNPSNQMITITFEDGSTCTLRNSGTEPKLKYYVEVSSTKSKEDASKKLEELTSLVIKELLRPKENGLVTPS